MMSSAEEVSTKRSTCLHNKLNAFAKGSQKATTMPLGLEIKGRRQARLKLAESRTWIEFHAPICQVQQCVKQMHGLFSKQTSPLVYTALPSLVYTLALHC